MSNINEANCPTKRVVGFSGGIDSQATALWCYEKYGKENTVLLFADTGHEHPVTYAFIRMYSETVHPVEFIKPLVKDLGDVGTVNEEIGKRRASLGEESELTMELLSWVKLFFPRSQIRFCTEYLKLQPQLRWMKERFCGEWVLNDFERYVGVRADESAARAKLPEREYDQVFDCWLNRPIHKWSKQECFDYVAKAGQSVNPLYRMGMNRVGCSPCIGQPKDQIREWSMRFPDEVKRVRAMEERVGKPFYAGKVAGLEGWIDEVIAWSNTKHGGKIALPMEDGEGERCKSMYGLCE